MSLKSSPLSPLLYTKGEENEGEQRTKERRLVSSTTGSEMKFLALPITKQPRTSTPT